MVYTLICDGCGADICKGDEFAGWSDPDIIMEYHEGKDWIEQEGKHYCADCWEWDADENDKIPSRQIDLPSTFKVHSLETVAKDAPAYSHWSEGLTLYIEKNGIQLKLDAGEVRQLVKALPQTIGGTY